ncbi:hypothetical protein ACFYN0_20255 [Streptomyces sp. NPDC006704]|uniref:hypothetical protein n=1 Tax=Streptomyces sp. NPDC006704 TaxID=3364760 RepID=UPI0036CDF1D9
MTHADQPVPERPASDRSAPAGPIPERPLTGQAGFDRGASEPSASGTAVGDPRSGVGPAVADPAGPPGAGAPEEPAPGRPGADRGAHGGGVSEPPAVGQDIREGSAPGQGPREEFAAGQDLREGVAPGRTVPEQGASGYEGAYGAGAGEADVLRPGERDKLRHSLQQAVGTFVDEPRAAVEEAASAVDSLAEQIIESLGERRGALRAQWQDASGGAATEDLRMALREYRRLAERLLDF